MDIYISICKEKLNQYSHGGVGMLLSPYTLKSLNSIEKISSDDSDLITFNNQLYSLVQGIPKLNVLIICGDIDAQISKDENNKFCLLNLSNRNGEYLKELSLENGQTCLNTKFQKGKGKLWTYT